MGVARYQRLLASGSWLVLPLAHDQLGVVSAVLLRMAVAVGTGLVACTDGSNSVPILRLSANWSTLSVNGGKLLIPASNWGVALSIGPCWGCSGFFPKLASGNSVIGLGTARVPSSNKPAASGGHEEGQGSWNGKGGNNSWSVVTVLCKLSTKVETLVGSVSSYAPSNSSTLLLGSVSGS